MSPEVKTKEKLGRHELAVGYITEWYEQPLLKRLWNRWGMQQIIYGQQRGNRGWLVCGPGTITLSRIINLETGIPILKDGDLYNQEHIRCSPPFFYKPPNGNIEDMMDHDVLEYFNGCGDVTLIDVTGQLTFGKKKHLKGTDDLKGAIPLRRFPISEYYDAMARDYHLYRVDVADPDYIAMHEYHNIPPPDAVYLEDYYAAKNSDRITDENPFATNIGQFYADDRYGLPLAQFIRTFNQEWRGIK